MKLGKFFILYLLYLTCVLHILYALGWVMNKLEFKAYFGFQVVGVIVLSLPLLWYVWDKYEKYIEYEKNKNII